MPKYDCIVVGSGPNGLSAAIAIAGKGLSVLVLEASPQVGGGCRTAEITLPGFHHDVCSAIHPMALASPFFRTLRLEKHGLDWVHPPSLLAHPLPNGEVAMLDRSVGVTSRALGEDGARWALLVEPFIARTEDLFGDFLRPLRLPRHPLLAGRFGLKGLQSCHSLVRSRFVREKASALFAGCAAHSVLSLKSLASASFGLMLAIAGHSFGWPCAKGGSQAIANALADVLRQLGGEIRTGARVENLEELPSSRAVLLDLTPRQIVQLARNVLPHQYTNKLRRFRYGPGVFKIDWALNAPVPWRSLECSRAGTVHVCGTFSEIAKSEEDVATGNVPEHPFVLFAQQSLFDETRARNGHTGWAYCHVPNGCDEDMTSRIESQIERFAPGFRDVIMARHISKPADLERSNANLVGGDIGGGLNSLKQFVFRPVVRWNPYATPNSRIFICSSSTPPGGGVHGMCGYWAAQSALRAHFPEVLRSG